MPHTLKPYPAYKPSGVEWLGDVPEHWELRKLKFIAAQVSEKVEIKSDNTNYIGLENIESWTGKLVESELVTEGTASRFRKNDVLFGKLRPYLAKVYLAEDEGFCSTEALVLRTSSQNPRFLFYFLLSRMFIDLVNSSVYGAKMPRASWDFIGSQLLPFPLLNEQHRIATFLDQKTAEIDEAITKKQRLIELLKEQKAILINQAITKGLNPNVPMKDSGVEWIGEVPAHWEVRKAKHLSKFVTSGPRGWAEYYTEEGSFFLQSGNLNDSVGIELERANRVTPPENAEGRRTRLRKNDVLVCVTGANTGRVALASFEDQEVFINQHLCLIRPISAVEPAFLAFCLHSIVGQTHFFLSQYGLKEGLGLDDVKSAIVLEPPILEQREISTFIEGKLKEFDISEASIKSQMDKLRELKSILISQAVTGKIKV